MRNPITPSQCFYRDWKDLARLMRESFPFLTPREIFYDLTTYRNGTILFRSDSQIIGFAICILDKGNNRVWLERIGVNQKNQGRGYGKQVLKTLETECLRAGFKGIDLSVFSDNKIAIQLYESLQYRLISSDSQKRIYAKNLADESITDSEFSSSIFQKRETSRNSLIKKLISAFLYLVIVRRRFF